MKTKVIANRLIPPRGYLAITLFGFIFTRDKGRINRSVLNHEMIHVRQQKEWLYVFFFLLYVIEYLFFLLKYRNHDKAYRSISFEREAYKNESDANYLKHRPRYANYRNG